LRTEENCATVFINDELDRPARQSRVRPLFELSRELAAQAITEITLVNRATRNWWEIFSV